MKASNTLLIVDDNKSILTTLQFLLSDYFEHILSLSSPQGILSLLDREQVDVILLDMNFSAGINSGNEGLFWLQEIKTCRSAGCTFYSLCRYRTGCGGNQKRGGRFYCQTMG